MATFDIAYMHPGTVRTEFAGSLVDTAIQHPNTAFLPMSGKNLVRNKNIATKWWLASSKKDWLLWVDSDIEWTQEGLNQLLATADEKGPSIVSGLGFHWSGGVIYLGFFTGRNSRGELAIESNTHHDFPRDEPFKILAAGGGCMLIHRDVLWAVEKRPHIEGYPWFFSGTNKDGGPTGYATLLSEGTVAEGYDIWLEPRFGFKHFEPVAITADLYDRWWGKE